MFNAINLFLYKQVVVNQLREGGGIREKGQEEDEL